MTNPFYNASGNPGGGSGGLSVPIRTEFKNIETGFGLLPTFSGNAGKAVVIAGGENALTTTTGALALSGNFSTTGAFNLVMALSASVTLSAPAVDGTIATLGGIEAMTNKTIGLNYSGFHTGLAGTLHIDRSMTPPATGAGATLFAIYVDSVTGNLMAKSGNGTITTLAPA